MFDVILSSLFLSLDTYLWIGDMIFSASLMQWFITLRVLGQMWDHSCCRQGLRLPERRSLVVPGIIPLVRLLTTSSRVGFLCSGSSLDGDDSRHSHNRVQYAAECMIRLHMEASPQLSVESMSLNPLKWCF